MTTIAAPLERPQVATASKPRPIGLTGFPVISWPSRPRGRLRLDDRVRSTSRTPNLYAAIAAALAFVALVWPIVRRGLIRRAALAALQLATVILVVVSADRAISAWEERALGSTASRPSPRRHSTCWATARGPSVVLLLLDHPDGLVPILPSMETLAVRPFLLCWLVWVVLRLVRNQGRVALAAAVGLAATVLVGLVRYVVLLAVYADHDEILAGFSGLACAGSLPLPLDHGAVPAPRRVRRGSRGPLARARTGRGSSLPTRALASRVWAILGAGAAVGGLMALAGLAGTFAPPGAEKPGRILIDDRFCGIWEPTARQLDTQWYGDFPTYSFTSLAEWLGKWYSVDANTTRPYDDELLSGYDVLILKTPEEPIPDAEVDAIDRFVRRGGGLLLVGDHTNLLGMGTHLNVLSARYGIQFRYDSVSDGVTGGFVDYVGPRIGRHVGALHVNASSSS